TLPSRCYTPACCSPRCVGIWASSGGWRRDRASRGGDLLAAHRRTRQRVRAPTDDRGLRPARARVHAPAAGADRLLLRTAGAPGAARLARLPAAHRTAAWVLGRVRALPSLRARDAGSAVLRAGETPFVRDRAPRKR